MKTAAVKMQGVSKAFGNDRALRNINVEMFPGEVCCVLGENGAGKSTFGKIICGIVPRDCGKLFIKDKDILKMQPYNALQMGIAGSFTEELLFNHLSIADNIFLGKEYYYENTRIIDEAKTNDNARKVLSTFGLDLDVQRKAGTLSLAECKMVELAKLFYSMPDVIVLDEPTAPLDSGQIARLFSLIGQAKERGACVIYITHNIEEVYCIADRVIVINHGAIVSDKKQFRKESPDSLVRDMAGEDYLNRYSKTRAKIGYPLMELREVTNEKRTVRGIDFSIHSGEVLGIAGLQGAGKTSLARLLFGLEKLSAGRIEIEGKQVNIKNPRDAISHGIAYVSDYALADIFPYLSVIDNIMIMSLRKFANKGLLRYENMGVYAREAMHYYRIKASNPESRIDALSVGNIQKVIICRWALVESKIFLLDDPTRHLDIPSKVEIYNLINRLTQNGMGILLISSDISELVGMCNRILVMNNGCIVKELFSDTCTTADVLNHSLGK